MLIKLKNIIKDLIFLFFFLFVIITKLYCDPVVSQLNQISAKSS